MTLQNNENHLIFIKKQRNDSKKTIAEVRALLAISYILTGLETFLVGTTLISESNLTRNQRASEISLLNTVQSRSSVRLSVKLCER